ncbi:hypothetical protein T484DRAFT_1769656, partial [Baffinella frigidus]
SVTPSQHASIAASLTSLPPGERSPLLCNLLARRVAQWPSSLAAPDHRLPLSVADAGNMFLQEVEERNGRVLVHHAMLVLLCARFGLSDAEMEKLLSAIPAVMEDVCQYHQPPDRKLPPLLWVRIVHDLGADLLVYRGVDGCNAATFLHRSLRDVAAARYSTPLPGSNPRP